MQLSDSFVNPGIEHVVLVNEADAVLGTIAKNQVHGTETPLHRGFSIFVFNKQHELLLQQRSGKKVTWPLVWSNSCCGHPALNEDPVDAAKRRLSDELGLTAVTVQLMAPYRYKFTKDGVMENEICPILVGKTTETPQPNPDEVEAFFWMPWEEFVQKTEQHPESYSPWCIEETQILHRSPEFATWLYG